MLDMEARVRKALGECVGTERLGDVDDAIADYVCAVLADDTFEWGVEGDGAAEAVGPILLDSGLVRDEQEAFEVCRSLATQFGNRVSVVSNGDYYRKLDAPKMFGNLHVIEDKPQPKELPERLLTARDLAKIERRTKREERARQSALEAHQAAAQEALDMLPPAVVWHNSQADTGAAPRDIHLNNFTITVAGKDLIESASITLAFGRRYGLVGRNGTGKTTFLRHMAAHAIDGIPPRTQILHVEQEVTGDDRTVLECVLACDVERTALLKEEAELLKASEHAAAPMENGLANGHHPLSNGKDDSAERLAAVYRRMEAIDAYSAEARASQILAGLSFTTEMQKKTTREFSGGWRMRVSLARALFIEPDVLLLDEPTNHLDLHAVIWLEDYLCKWKKTLIVVSHAREFLNVVVTDVIHLQHQKLTAYRGNYDTFEKTRNERLRNAAKAHESSEKARSHIQMFIDKFRYNAKRASLVQSRIKALERMAKVELAEDDPEYVFKFPTPDGGPGPPIISFTDACFNYPGGPMLFKNLNFGIDLDSRLAMVGANGVGKSTLLKLIAGELEPTSGTVFRSNKVRMSVFSQHHVDGLDLASTPLLYMMKLYPNTAEPLLRAHLGSFGISGNLALQPMYTLSGGQKSRVALAKITWTKPHILLLDEPSNHLDLDAVEALIHGLALFQGGVLMVSHDEHLISGVVDDLWVVKQGVASPFHGAFDDYKKTLKV
eukprot:jgi/Chlat1/8241/Chrsp77S07670